MSPPPPYTYVPTMHTHCINIHTDTLYAHTVHSSHLCQLLAVHFRALNISLNSSLGKQHCCPSCYRNVGASSATSHPNTFLDNFLYLVCLFSAYPCGISPRSLSDTWIWRTVLCLILDSGIYPKCAVSAQWWHQPPWDLYAPHTL